MIKAVLFDVGATLIEPQPGIGGVFHEVACSRGHTLDYACVAKHTVVVEQFYEDEYLRDGDFWCSPIGSVEIYLEMYRYLANLTGLADDAEGIAQAVYEAYLTPDYWCVLEDVTECLRELKRNRIRLGVVSNWAPNLEGLLRGLMLKPYFEEIISSADVGYRKPDPLIFQLMLERMGLSSHEVIHVGDRPDADGFGAACAGVTPLIIDRNGAYSECEYAVTDSLKNLPRLIEDKLL